MNTQFFQKALSPNKSVMRSKLEVWGYNFINSILVGGASAVTTSIGLVIIHGSGVQDVPTINIHIFGTLFLGGAIGKGCFFLAQGLPALQNNSDSQPTDKPTQ